MKCDKCGTKNPKNFKYCKECGEELRATGAVPSTPPPTTIIIRERERRGVPWFIWALIGVILLVLLCCLLMWLNVVSIPCELFARLPGPMADFIDGINHQWAAECVDQQDNRQELEVPQIVVPDNQGQDQQQEPDDPPFSEPPDVDDDLCNEDLADTFAGLSVYAPEFSKAAYIDFEFWEPPQSDEYLVFILEGQFDSPESWMVQFAQNNICREGSWYDDGMFHLCQDTPLQYEAGMATFVFYDSRRDCIAGMIQNYSECKSGEYYYHQIDDCCSVGCMCALPSWGYGCWQSCAPECVED